MKNRLLFLGPPGAGKGTQAKLLCAEDQLMHLSTGDLLRAEVKSGTALGLEASLIMNKGELVSDQIVLSIVENRLKNIENGWLLDGFPRNLLQAKALQNLLEKIDQAIQAVVLIDLKDKILIERLLSRGRTDDTERVIRNRLEIYRDKTAPLIDHYSSLGILKTVHGEGEIDEISQRIKTILE